MTNLNGENIKRGVIGGLIFAFCLLSFVSEMKAAHKFHTSLTRIDYKPEDKNIEFTIRVFTDDLQRSLELFAKKRVDFEKSKETDKIIENYLTENFILSDKKNEILKLKWVGREINADMMTIYLETSINESISGYRLQNTIFFELFADQTNLVIAGFDGKKADLLFKTGDKFKIIAENK